MVVLVTWEYEEDPIKNEGARMLTRFFIHVRAGYSQVLSRIGPKFKLVQAFIVVFVTCKNEEDPIKNEGERVLIFLPLYVNVVVFLRSGAAYSAVLRRILPKFEIL